MSEADRVRRVVTVVYVAMVAAVGVYSVVVALLPRPSSGMGASPRLRWTLFALGTGEYVMATVLARRNSSLDARRALERARSGFLIRFAAAEAIAIFGLILHFLGAPAGSVLAFFGASMVAFAVAFPSREAFEEPSP